MQSITKAAKAQHHWIPAFSSAELIVYWQGCICGWDLAHAVGNVDLSLHDWDVDFAVWCSYKYLNSGPGGIGGLFVHEKWDDRNLPKYGGWWGHELATRFDMPPTFSPTRGAQGFQQSNPSVLCVAALDGSLQVFKDAGMMASLRARSVRLTAYLEKKLTSSAHYIPPHEVASRYPAGAAGVKPAFTIITPSDPESRGSQLSLKFLPLDEGLMMNVYRGLKSFGVVADERKPDVIRLAPTALYNTSEDCDRAAHALEETFKTLL
ncbi:hypothetical protein EWM64_g7270 [Hericium alpestre]|uniref:Aminotransferase class V domain-containing protein n=1 Tax=Hericium alpestre TaxID=135208 RepID=A0A4Y9ZPN6_9AGAM|nr:hypothetical protein EWM64_g7270 [Hericium alpestre]